MKREYKLSLELPVLGLKGAPSYLFFNIDYFVEYLIFIRQIKHIYSSGHAWFNLLGLNIHLKFLG